jgi:hypothetical protein
VHVLARHLWLAALLVGSGCGARSTRQQEQPNAAGGSPKVSCRALCDYQASLGCGGATDECEVACVGVGELPTSLACENELNEQRACLVELSADRYECIDGVLTAGDACQSANASLLSCLLRKRGPYAACDRVCELSASLHCAPAVDIENCARNCANIGLVGTCADETLAWFSCVAQSSPGELVCESSVLGAVDGSCDDELDNLHCP